MSHPRVATVSARSFPACHRDLFAKDKNFLIRGNGIRLFAAAVPGYDSVIIKKLGAWAV